MKNISLNSWRSPIYYTLIAILFLIGCSQPPLPKYEHEELVQWKDFDYLSPDYIEVIYPKDSQVVSAVDSTFILGNIKSYLPDSVKNSHLELVLNGKRIHYHPDGGFIAYVPIEPGTFSFNFQLLRIYHWHRSVMANLADSVLNKTITVIVPEPITPIPIDSLTIRKEVSRPYGDLVVRTGDRIEVSFQGTAGCDAWFAIPGVADSVPMGEMSPRPQPYWGESVFGSGAVPESLLIKGIYSGFYEISPDDIIDTTHIEYYLSYPDKDSYIKYIQNELDSISQLSLHQLPIHDSEVVSISSSYQVSINPDEYPFTVKFTDSVQTIRHGPRKGYLTIFQPEGVEALVVGKEGDWYISQFSASQKAYIYDRSVERLAQGILPPHSYLPVVRMKNESEKLKVEIPLSGKHPYQIFESDRQTIRLRLYGVTADTDWIRHDFSDRQVDLVTWEQVEPGLYELTIRLKQPIWGYDGYYVGNSFYLDINKPPDEIHKLEGKTIVVDPGHSRDPGAVGPTGMTEAEANLMISLKLRGILEKQGAHVIMTRTDTSHVALYDRPAIANEADADLFVSIHNNALPDGVNPFENNGSSCYYYHPHSIDLARSIHKELTVATQLGDYGLYHGNLAVNRPTQYPAVLVECAFMIIPEQEALLKTDTFQSKVAKSIARGIKNYFHEFDNE